MPAKKYEKLLNQLEKSSVFSFKSLESRVGKSYAKLLIHNLLKKGKITKLLKGWYSFKKSPYLITIPLEKAYVGLGSAAVLYNTWNQAISINILSPNASVKIKQGERIIAGEKVIIRKISPKMYFGYKLLFIKDINEWIRVSDPEKTLIDMIYYSYPFIEEILPNLKKIVKKEKLIEYLNLMKKRKVKGWKKVEEKLAQLRLL